MKQNSLPLKMNCFILALALLASGCASTTMIRSIPDNAKLYIDGEPVGVTPYEYSDSKIIGSSTEVRIEKDGFETYYTQFYRLEEPDPGAIICGMFFTPIWWLWGAKYKPGRTYALVPLIGNAQPNELNNNLLDNTNQLRELKKLLDEGIITQEEFNAKKKQILEAK